MRSLAPNQLSQLGVPVVQTFKNTAMNATIEMQTRVFISTSGRMTTTT